MENWEYDELFHTIKEFYEEFLEENRRYRYAAARLLSNMKKCLLELLKELQSG